MNGDEFAEHFSDFTSIFKRIVPVFIIVFGVLFLYSGNILEFLQLDLGVDLHGLTPYEILVARLSLSAYIAVFVLYPYFGFELLRFLRPGLTGVEYRYLRNYLPVSYILFVVGCLFSYFVVFSTAVSLLQLYTSAAGASAVWSISSTILFGVQLSVLCGVMFQVPVVAALLTQLGLIDYKGLKGFRSNFVLIVLVLSALVTPPDLVTLLLVSVPLMFLYEVSIWISRLLG